MRSRNALALAGFIVLAESAGIVDSIVTLPSIPTWYTALAKPLLSPPAWVFAPVWTILYLLMGVAAFLIWHSATAAPKARRWALGLFVVQLVLNALWSVLFFGIHHIDWALVDIALLWLAIAATIVEFRTISRTAAWLLIPYIVWVSFALYLNYALFVLN